MKGGLIYGFGNGIWVALNGTYFTGGRATVEGVEGDDLQKNSRAAITVALPVNRNHSVKLYASTGVSTRIGTDSDTIGIAWQYRWGGGL
ncbi:MAG: hypothetical protein H6R23_2739 [Proteobacteria bacterium]|nr:hypothetical protein [Pseudomonadota bacterium]